MSGNLEAVFEECYRLIGDGTVDVCQQAIKNGCVHCCSSGTVLFDDEKLLCDVPEGVEVTKNRVKNCMQNGVCVFGDKKPLFCRISPRVVFLVDELTGSEVSCHVLKDGSVVGRYICPVYQEFPSDFKTRVDAVVDVLKKNGVWKYDNVSAVSYLGFRKWLDIVFTVFVSGR